MVAIPVFEDDVFHASWASRLSTQRYEGKQLKHHTPK